MAEISGRPEWVPGRRSSCDQRKHQGKVPITLEWAAASGHYVGTRHQGRERSKGDNAFQVSEVSTYPAPQTEGFSRLRTTNTAIPIKGNGMSRIVGQFPPPYTSSVGPRATSVSPYTLHPA